MEVVLTPLPNIYNQNVYSYNDFIYKESVKKNEFWESTTLINMINLYEENTDVIDIGANIGLISLGFLSLLKTQNRKYNNLHCFECDTSSFNLLSMNLYHHPRVNLYPFALADSQKICRMSQNQYNLGCNFIYESVDQTTQENFNYSFIPKTNLLMNKICVMAVSLDSLEYQFPNRIGLIKIHVFIFFNNKINTSIFQLF